MTYAVGEEVGYGMWHWGTLINSGIATISKINGHGHIHLSNGKVFDKHGRVRDGSTRINRIHLMKADGIRAYQAEREATIKRNDAAKEAIKIIQSTQYGKLADDLRAQLLALVEQL
jgi:hypothetical protein